jgi:tetratricopeptide (TPR) repeat protein
MNLVSTAGDARKAFLIAALLPSLLGAQTAAEHFKRGRALLDSNKADAAVKAFEKAVALDDKNSEYHRWLGDALGSVAQHASVFRQPFLAKRIKSEFERTVQLDPSSLQGHDGLLQFYLLAPGIMGGSVTRAREQAELIAASIRSRDMLSARKSPIMKRMPPVRNGNIAPLLPSIPTL